MVANELDHDLAPLAQGDGVVHGRGKHARAVVKGEPGDLDVGMAQEGTGARGLVKRPCRRLHILDGEGDLHDR